MVQHIGQVWCSAAADALAEDSVQETQLRNAHFGRDQLGRPAIEQFRIRLLERRYRVCFSGAEIWIGVRRRNQRLEETRKQPVGDVLRARKAGPLLDVIGALGNGALDIGLSVGDGPASQQIHNERSLVGEPIRKKSGCGEPACAGACACVCACVVRAPRGAVGGRCAPARGR